MESSVEPHMEKVTQAWSSSRTLACRYACTESAVDAATECGMDTRFRCAQGFSALQINILSVIKAHTEVLAYWQIAQIVHKHYGGEPSEGAVRGALERLFPRDFLLRSRATRGRLKGNRYALARDPCALIPPCNAGMEANTEPGAHSDGQRPPSFLKEETERKTLSISSQEASAERRLDELSEEDIAFHWPTLARDGFGTDQVRQICQRLRKIGLLPDKVLQGLAHAEWETARGGRTDAQGKPIARPAHWVFETLARQGYYPRPAGYVSPQEQAERDAALEQTRLAEALDARLEAAQTAWTAQLSPEEKTRILQTRHPAGNGPVRIPESVILRSHFRAEVWPSLQRGEGT